MPGKHPRQRQQPFQLRVADTASPYRIADIFGEVLVYIYIFKTEVCIYIDFARSSILESTATSVSAREARAQPEAAIGSASQRTCAWTA